MSFQQSNSCLLAPPARPQQNASHHWQEAPKQLGVWGSAWVYMIDSIARCLNNINFAPKIQPKHLTWWMSSSDVLLSLRWVPCLESIHGPEVLHDTSGIARLEELHFCQAMTTGDKVWGINSYSWSDGLMVASSKGPGIVMKSYLESRPSETHLRLYICM